jgi:hypothetical protein
MNTHFLPFDANAPRRQPRYALCGVMTSGDRHAAQPSCLACRRLLIDDDASLRALAPGQRDEASRPT